MLIGVLPICCCRDESRPLRPIYIFFLSSLPFFSLQTLLYFYFYICLSQSCSHPPFLSSKLTNNVIVFPFPLPYPFFFPLLCIPSPKLRPPSCQLYPFQPSPPPPPTLPPRPLTPTVGHLRRLRPEGREEGRRDTGEERELGQTHVRERRARRNGGRMGWGGDAKLMHNK